MLQPSHLPSEAVVATTATPATDGPPLLWQLLNDLQDGAVLSDEDGTIVLATRRVAEMFGYQVADLAGRPVQSLIPAARPGNRYRHRPGGARPLRSWPAGSGERLTGLHQDGTLFPVEISLSQVTFAGGPLTLTAIREIAQGLRLGDLAQLPHSTGPQRPAAELTGAVLTSLIQARSCLQAAFGQPAEAARQRLAVALNSLDHAIGDIHGILSAAPSQERA